MKQTHEKILLSDTELEAVAGGGRDGNDVLIGNQGNGFVFGEGGNTPFYADVKESSHFDPIFSGGVFVATG